MRLLILVGLSIYTRAVCGSENEDKVENKGRRLAGGGNYGGFIGLTTYGAGPFLVKGKFERNEYSDSKDDERGFKDDVTFDPKFIRNVAYENIQKDQLPGKYIENKDEDEYLEYLGYRGPRGYCIGEFNNSYYSENMMRTNNSSDFYYNEVRERCDRLFGYTGQTANDGPENLVRPCALDDWQCIRNYFAANSNCKPAFGPIPDPLYIDVNTVFYPVVNLTVTLPNLMVRGLSNTRIREFYVNKRTGNLVLALDVTNLNETIPRAYFRYRRTAKESIVLADYATATYRGIIFTAVIPNMPHLRLDLADIHAEVQDTVPLFFVGPGASNSTDPDVISAFAQFNALIPIAVREAFLFQSQLFTSIYIQENICDFGLKLISV